MLSALLSTEVDSRKERADTLGSGGVDMCSVRDEPRSAVVRGDRTAMEAGLVQRCISDGITHVHTRIVSEQQCHPVDHRLLLCRHSRCERGVPHRGAAVDGCARLEKHLKDEGLTILGGHMRRLLPVRSTRSDGGACCD